MKTQYRKLWLNSFVLLFSLMLALLALKPGLAEAALNPPINVFAKTITSTSIGVNWVPVAGATEYRIYRSTNGTTYIKVATSAGNLNGYFQDTNLTSSTLYYYRVTAYSTVEGESAQSAATQYSRTTTLAPAAPRGLKAVDNRDGTVTLTWEANQEVNILGYNIYRGTVSGGNLSKINTVMIPASARTYQDNTISFYVDHYYRVTAVDNNNKEGAQSPELWIKPEAVSPVDVPHIDFSANSEPCAVCHVTHTAVGEFLITEKTEVDLCFTCHDGTGSQNITYQEFSSTSGSRHPVQAGTNTGTLKCSNCHDPHLSYQNPDNPKLLSVDYNGLQTKGNSICYKCHGVGSTLKGGDHETPFQNGIHNSSVPDPASGTQIKCSNCHEPHASPNEGLQVYKEENACLQCHAQSSNPQAPDIYARVYANPDSDTHHDIFNADQAKNGSKVECTNCHNPHGVTADKKVVNPESPGPTNLWGGSKNDFCLTCHDGSFPTESQTAPYTTGVTSGTESLINIKNAWQTDQHGLGVGGSNVILDPAMGYTRGTVLNCDNCHEPHGTPNNYNLRTSVVSKDGTYTKDGLMIYKIADGQYDLRYFCNACHGRKHMGNNKPWPTNCTTSNCHTHGRNSF